MTKEQLDAILAHELCHIRSCDNLTAAIHMVVEAVFWFHPIVWWLGERLLDERERACDEEVLLLGSDPEAYAESILKACQFYLESPLPCVSGVTGADLERRIERIMTNSRADGLDVARRFLLAAAGFAAVAAPIAMGLLHPAPGRAQSPAAFEVASIKPHRAVPGPFRVTRSAENGTLTYMNVTPRLCIRLAYGLKGYQVSGGPNWLGEDRYDIVAKAAGRATEFQMMPMLQTLLLERFKLVVHRETKELPIYELVVAKDGPKIHEAKDDGNGTEIDGDEQHPITARNVSMSQLAGILSRAQEVEHPVFDRTGLKGTYNLSLRFSADPSGDMPDIFGALQEQLGLKLLASKGQAEILVIDHAEKPKEN